MVADIQAVSGLRDDANKERLGALERTLREVHRGVQIIRDKQVREAQQGQEFSKEAERPCTGALRAQAGRQM